MKELKETGHAELCRLGSSYVILSALYNGAHAVYDDLEVQCRPFCANMSICSTVGRVEELTACKAAKFWCDKSFLQVSLIAPDISDTCIRHRDVCSQIGQD